MGTSTLTQTEPTAPDANEDWVALAGDWHGNIAWAIHAVSACVQIGATRIYHLGDFGVWPGADGRLYLDLVEERCAELDIEIWVTPGNHEDYDQINAVPVGDQGLQWIRPHIALIPRGHRWVDGERTFVSLGGAPSIDFEHRRKGTSWWREEMITPEEAAMVAEGGHADIMLAHDSPDDSTPAVERILSGPSWWTFDALAYAAQGREQMNTAFRGVLPKLFAHGHYHVGDDTGPSRTPRLLSLAHDGEAGNVVLLRLGDLGVSWDGGRTWS